MLASSPPSPPARSLRMPHATLDDWEKKDRALALMPTASLVTEVAKRMCAVNWGLIVREAAQIEATCR